jgi:hypothetical protein
MFIYFFSHWSAHVMSLFYIQQSVGIKQPNPGLGFQSMVKRYLIKPCLVT